MNKKQVAVIYSNGKCTFVAECKLIGNDEFARLSNEMIEHEQEKNKRIADLENKVRKLELDISLDRGLITKEQYDSEVIKLC